MSLKSTEVKQSLLDLYKGSNQPITSNVYGVGKYYVYNCCLLSSSEEFKLILNKPMSILIDQRIGKKAYFKLINGDVLLSKLECIKEKLDEDESIDEIAFIEHEEHPLYTPVIKFVKVFGEVNYFTGDYNFYVSDYENIKSIIDSEYGVNQYKFIIGHERYTLSDNLYKEIKQEQLLEMLESMSFYIDYSKDKDDFSEVYRLSGCGVEGRLLEIVVHDVVDKLKYIPVTKVNGQWILDLSNGFDNSAIELLYTVITNRDKNPEGGLFKMLDRAVLIIQAIIKSLNVK